jgi:hypothetical protein
MSVGVHRRADIGVPDVALDREGMRALVDQQGDAGVAHLVRIERPQSGFPHSGFQKRVLELW